MAAGSVRVLLLAMGAIMALAVIFGAVARFYDISSRGGSPVESEQEILESNLAKQQIDRDEYVRKHAGQRENKRAA